MRSAGYNFDSMDCGRETGGAGDVRASYHKILELRQNNKSHHNDKTTRLAIMTK
jgi:hypothetical protein